MILMLSPHLAFAGCALGEVANNNFSDISSSAHWIAKISVNCDDAYRIGLDAGMWFFGIRRLHDGKGNFITYRLWQDSTATQEWGDSGFPLTSYAALPLSVSNGTALHTVFANLIGAENAPPGEYHDTTHVLLDSPPYAATVHSSTNVSLSARIEGACSMDVNGIHGFGIWPVGSTNPTGVALGSISVRCSSGVRYTVGMDAGRYYNGIHRRMYSGTTYISYVLRGDLGTEWGDAGLNTIVPNYMETYPAPAAQGDGDGGVHSFFVWGDVDISSAPAATYSDTVNVTVVW